MPTSRPRASHAAGVSEAWRVVPSRRTGGRRSGRGRAWASAPGRAPPLRPRPGSLLVAGAPRHTQRPGAAGVTAARRGAGRLPSPVQLEKGDGPGASHTCRLPERGTGVPRRESMVVRRACRVSAGPGAKAGRCSWFRRCRGCICPCHVLPGRRTWPRGQCRWRNRQKPVGGRSARSVSLAFVVGVRELQGGPPSHGREESLRSWPSLGVCGRGRGLPRARGAGLRVASPRSGTRGLPILRLQPAPPPGHRRQVGQVAQRAWASTLLSACGAADLREHG